jgi:hypothetical protein
MLERDVVKHGVGLVERSIVVHIMTLLQANGYQRQKTIITLFAVRRSRDSSRMTIVQEVIQDIVVDGGKRSV